LAQHPEAARGYDVNVATGPERPARVSWQLHEEGADDHAAPRIFHAALAPDGSLQVQEEGPSPVAQFVDVLHQQVGLPFDHEISMPIMGAISLLYAIAIVSGVIVLLPSLVSDLFAMRVGRNVKRMWLDLHNLLGVCSLPFHLIMALTAVVFAFHDQFYAAQELTFSRPEMEQARPAGGPQAPLAPKGDPLQPAEVLRRVERQAPGFRVQTISYAKRPTGEAALRITGDDPRYGLRAPTYGVAQADAYTGELTGTDYMPGHQDGWGATITSFFSLHFGSFGGLPVRWAYFLLGIAGAFIFYTGNLLWIESRRKRERKAGAVEQTRSTRILAALTVGVPLGCVAGISVTIAAAKPLGLSATEGLHSAIYYAVFLAFTGWALLRGSARAGVELLPVAAAGTALVPLASIAFAAGHPPVVPLVDVTAAIIAAGIMWTWRYTLRRSRSGPRDSVWSVQQAAA